MDTNVIDTPERDRGLLGLVERIMRRPEAAETGIDRQDAIDPVIPGEVTPTSLEPQVSIESTRSLTRTELAGIILRALRRIDGCPARGLQVIVYGSRPWNAMLRITPAAGPVADASAWRARVQSMIPLLRQQYDLVEDPD